jgi:hypothetical protein
MNDDELIARLRGLAEQVDAPPDWTAEAARAALTTRRLDGELAALVLDSATDETAVARGPDEELRLVSFEAPAVSVELQIHGGSLRGLVTGASGEVTVEGAAGALTVPIGADGWFTVDRVQPGRLRLRLRADAGTNVTTSWITI